MSIPRRLTRLHPGSLILMSFIAVILVGTCLLKLPGSVHTPKISWIDALFTATSAVCVTGLVVHDTGSAFTLFGQGVILGLIQIGGLGVMTISVLLFRWIGYNVSFRQRMVMQDLFSPKPRKDIFKLIKSIVLFTLAAEGIGTVLLTWHWNHEFPLRTAIYYAVFHSVSAFCNAGFALLNSSMVDYSACIYLNLTICSLIIIGGIGFPVLYDLQSWVCQRRKSHVRLSIQTRTVLRTTAILIILGTVIFLFSERHTPCPGGIRERLLTAVFQSVTCRTAGFNTVDIAGLHNSTLMMMIVLMFIGASPGSCGGGVKTTTLAILAAFTRARIQRHHRVNLYHKSIPPETVTRSVSLVLVSMTLIGVVLFLTLIGETGQIAETGQRRPFLAHLFETVSAFGTVGLSMGLTPELNTWGKSLIILTMIIGRVGVLTFAYIIVGSGTLNGVEYSEENMMVG